MCAMTTKGITNPKDASGRSTSENLGLHMEGCSCPACGPAPSRTMDVSDPDFGPAIGPIASYSDENTGVEDADGPVPGASAL